MPIPRNRDKVLEDLQHEKFIKKNDAGTWDITNMGALMIAKDLKKFESLHRRTVRVIWYKENSRLEAIREKEFCAGYAFSHEELAPRIENQNNQFTKAILFAKVPFELTTKEDRMRTCYMQACLAYVNFEGISNSDIRKIFGLGEKEKAKASRLLTSAVDGGYIKVMDPDTAPRYKKYIPYWA